MQRAGALRFRFSGELCFTLAVVAEKLPIEQALPPVLTEALGLPPVSDEDALFPPLPPEADTPHAKEISFKLARSRAKAAALIALRQQGYTRKEIGRLLGMHPNAVRVALNRARSQGKLNELRAVLENDSLALAVEGLNYHLEKRDKDAIFKHLEGMGHWKSYSNNKSEGGGSTTLPPLQVNVSFNNAPVGAVIASEPMGTPREDD